jgi:alkylation response protein AidB-like acyl-CoA dehydrogenase
MNLELTDEQRALRDTVCRYLSEKASVHDHVRPLLDDRTGVTDAVWQGLVDLGSTALLVPTEHGGDGMSMTEAGLVCEELGAALHPGPWVSTAVAAPRAVSRFGADGPETAELLRGIAGGSLVVAVAVPGRGGLPLLTETEGGAALHGAVGQVPDAAKADVILVVAAAPATVLCAVSTTDPAVALAEEPGIDPSRKLFRVSFDGALACRLAEADAAAADALIDDVIVAWAADALGAARQVLQMTVDHAKVRRQFGAPIGSFQAVAHLCVDMHETVELARSGVSHALWAADFADPAERHRAALRLKGFSGRLAAVGDQAIQVFGGIGFTWEHDAHLYLRRLLGFSRFLGRPDEHLERLGREMTGLAT